MQAEKKKLSELRGMARLALALKYVMPYFRPYKRSVVMVMFLSVLSNIFEPALALSTKLFIKFVFEDKLLIMVPLVPVCFLLLILIRESTNFLYEFNREKLSIKVVQDLQCSVYEHFIHLSLDHYDKISTGELMSRTVRDVSHMQSTVPMVIDLVKHLLKLLSLVAVCLIMQPVLTGITFLILPFAVWPITTIGGRMKRYTKKGLEQAAFINVHMQETFSGARIVKAFNQEKEEVNHYWDNMLKMLGIQIKYARAKYLQAPFTNIIAGLGAALVLGIAVWWALQTAPTMVSAGWWFFAGGVPVKQTLELLPRMSQPNFFAFFAALGMLLVPLRDLAKVQGNIQTTYGAIERVIESFEKQPSVVEAKDAVELPAMTKEIRYENVNFKYQDQWVLKDFNLAARKGELIALVGPSGAGKTTVVNLLPRFYEATQGRISIDGVDIKKASFKSLRRQIGIVTQETFLFNETVENNIKYGSPEKTRQQVADAAKAANADKFINKLPHGYDTFIGERGVRLSGGERQRIAIARALLRNPPILLLDEATSSLDTEAEREVQKALDNLMKNRTTIAIAHRLSTIRNADRIIVLSEGQIVEQGTHEQLLKRSGLYRKLYEMQFLVGEEVPAKEESSPELAQNK